jgi:hypothetical protein
MNSIRTRNLALILLTAGMLTFLSVLVLGEDVNFVGIWKGEYKAGAAAPGATPETAPAPAPAPPTGGGGGGGRGGGGGGFGGGGGSFGGGGPQKITLRVKVNKDKASGNFTMGSDPAEDIRESKIEGNKLTFKTGLPPKTIYNYEAVLIGETLSVTRTAEGGRGGRPTLFNLMRSK